MPVDTPSPGLPLQVQAQERVRVQAAALEAAANAILITDREGRITWANPAFERLSGYRLEEVLGKNPRLLGSGRHNQEFYRQMWETVLAGQDWRGELINRRKDGSLYHEEMTITPVRDSAGGVSHFIAIKQDITERLLAEQALRESEARYRELFQNAAHGIYRSTLDGRLLDVNPALVRILGYSSAQEMLGLNLGRDVYRNTGDRDAMLEQFLRPPGRVEGVEVEWKRKDDRAITVRLSGRAVRSPDGAVDSLELIVEDVTERRLLERQLRAAQKFEAIGQLAGGIAHDFNNVLGAILGWAELAMMETPPGHPLYEHLSKIRDQGERAADLTRQLLAFARRQILAPRNVDLNQVVTDTMRLLEKVIGTDIELRLDLAPAPDPALADPTQVEQVLVNLSLNARDAMPRGGRLAVETRNVEFDKSFCRAHQHARPGHFVMLAVCDSGVGMDPATLEHIFEPFFTTKETGKGTGLGLATVYGIVKQHNGFLHVYSEAGQGTTFKVYLPVGAGVAEQKQRVEAAPARGGTETILLAEDHEGLRELARETLERHGYRVLVASDGEEAVVLFRQHTEEIALLLLDVVLPRLSGPDAFTRISALRPNVPVLFMTGYTSDAPMLDTLAGKRTTILQKPYVPENLARQVREILDRVAQPR